MQNNCNWKSEFDREIQRAEQARASGNEGMARVCARRAAGVAAKAYLEQQGRAAAGSVLNVLQSLRDAPTEPEAVRAAAGHFLLRITPEHVLPEDVDLLADVRWLVSALFPQR
jgi:hypothetical protein